MNRVKQSDVYGYVLGFLFDEAETKVVLIEKQKPEWQKGHLNGVGGKIEEKDCNDYHLPKNNAMVREFEEETGVTTFPDNWRHFATLKGNEWSVYCMLQFNTAAVNKVRTTTSEKIIVPHLWELESYPILSNLRWLIPMALDKNMGNPPFFANVQY